MAGRRWWPNSRCALSCTSRSGRRSTTAATAAAVTAATMTAATVVHPAAVIEAIVTMVVEVAMVVEVMAVEAMVIKVTSRAEGPKPIVIKSVWVVVDAARTVIIRWTDAVWPATAVVIGMAGSGRR